MPVHRQIGLCKSVSNIPLGLFSVQRTMCIRTWMSMCICVFVCGFVCSFLRQLSRQRELMVFSQCVCQFFLFLKQKHSPCHDHMLLNIIFYYRIPQYQQWTQLCYFQFSSVAQLCPTLRHHGLQYARLPCPSPTPRAYSNSCLSSHDAIQPSHPLLSPSLPAFNLSQHQGLFKWISFCIRWPKYWSFSFNTSPSNEHPGLISFRMDWLDLLAVQGTLKSLLQHHSSKASILWCSAFLIVQLSHPYLTIGKTIALTRWTFVSKVMSLLFNMLS